VECLTVFPQTLNDFFGTSDIVSQYAKNPDQLEEMLLEIEDVDITFSATRKIIKNLNSMWSHCYK